MKPFPRTRSLVAAGLFSLVVPAACADSDDDKAAADPAEGLGGDGDGDRDTVNMPGDGEGFGGFGGEGGTDGVDGIPPAELPMIPAEGGPLNLPGLAAPAPCGLSAAPFLLGGNVDAAGYLVVLDDVSSAGDLGMGGASQLEGAMPLEGATSHTVFADGTAYVGFWEKPTIEKWRVDGVLGFEKLGSLNLASAGVSSTGSTRQLIQVMSSSKAYYFDPENNYVLGFNPSTMQLDGVLIDLTPGFGPANDRMALGDVHRDGEHLVVSARFWDADYNVRSIIRAAFIDARDDSVTFAEDTRCGDVAWHATDSAGNLYLGSHYDNVGANHVQEFGITGTDSCIVRINRGERAFDPDYYVDMDELVGGIGTTLLEGPGDEAYVMKYAGPPITRENWDQVRSGATWELLAVTLGAEEIGPSPLDFGGQKFNPTPTLFCADSSQAMIALSGADFEGGQLFVVDSAHVITPALSYPGALGNGVSLQ